MIQPPPTPTPDPPKVSLATILILDDQPQNLVILASTLRPFYQVRAATSGLQCLAVASSEPRPDLILLDIDMPDMDGYQVLQSLRDNPVTQGIPVIFVTALDTEDSEQRGLDLGAVDYITKPVKPAILLARVRIHLELREARERLAHQNTWLEAQVAERTQALKHQYIETIKVFSDVVESAPGIPRNGRNKADLARRVAKVMDLDSKSLQDLIFAALLLQIGKVGLPSSLLSRPFELLSQPERADYRKHAVAGAQLLSSFSQLNEVARIVRHQYEHLDGSGVPDHLTGAEIPLGSRILAVIQEYLDTLEGQITGKRETVGVTQQRILRKRGTHFDLKVVNALIEVVGWVGGASYRPILSLTVDELYPGMNLLVAKSKQVVYLNSTILTEDNIRALQLARDQGVQLEILVRARTDKLGQG